MAPIVLCKDSLLMYLYQWVWDIRWCKWCFRSNVCKVKLDINLVWCWWTRATQNIYTCFINARGNRSYGMILILLNASLEKYNAKWHKAEWSCFQIIDKRIQTLWNDFDCFLKNMQHALNFIYNLSSGNHDFDRIIVGKKCQNASQCCN